MYTYIPWIGLVGRQPPLQGGVLNGEMAPQIENCTRTPPPVLKFKIGSLKTSCGVAFDFFPVLPWYWWCKSNSKSWIGFNVLSSLYGRCEGHANTLQPRVPNMAFHDILMYWYTYIHTTYQYDVVISCVGPPTFVRLYAVPHRKTHENPENIIYCCTVVLVIALSILIALLCCTLPSNKNRAKKLVWT